MRITFLIIFDLLFGAPKIDWIRFGCFFLGIVLFIGIAEKTRKALKWSPEVTRKLVHISTGILIFFTPYFFTSQKPLIWMAIIFIIVNFIGIRSGALKSMHGTDRRTYGTVFYPLTFLILVITCWNNHQAVMVLSMLILGISDAAAAIVGENLKSPHHYFLGRDKKSLEGTIVMFLTTFFIILFLLPTVDILDGKSVSLLTAVWVGAITACIATALEALSTGGSDNLTAPLGGALIIGLMLNQPVVSNLQLTVGLILGLLIGIIALLLHFLTLSGSVGAFILATLIYGIGGWLWTVPILTFFIISSLLSKIGKPHKERFNVIFEKSNTRDIGQVLANGSIAGLTLLGNLFFPNPAWYILFLGALSAVNADTWATELGIFSKKYPVSIRDFKKVPHGTSGGITLLGSLSGFLGASVIALSGWLMAPSHFHLTPKSMIFWLIVLAGFLASFIDSLLGATIQAQYRCPVCQKTTEKPVHCSQEKTRLVSGFYWLNNDWVNLFCSVSGLVILQCLLFFLNWNNVYLFGN